MSLILASELSLRKCSRPLANIVPRSKFMFVPLNVKYRGRFCREVRLAFLPNICSYLASYFLLSAPFSSSSSSSCFASIIGDDEIIFFSSSIVVVSIVLLLLLTPSNELLLLYTTILLLELITENCSSLFTSNFFAISAVAFRVYVMFACLPLYEENRLLSAGRAKSNAITLFCGNIS